MTNKFITFVMTIALFGTANSEVEIKPIEAYLINDARSIIYHAVFEFQIIPSTSLNDVIQEIEQTGLLSDMDDIRSIENTYNNEKGTFLVILEDSQLMGMGAIKHLDDRSCELTRMFFAREYRNKGYGSLLMQQLMLFAKESGYERVKLNIWNSHTQSNAIAFYKKFGFYTIEPYKVCAAKVFMEKEL